MMVLPTRFRPRFTSRLLLVFMALFGAVLIPLIWKVEKARRESLRKARQERQLVEEVYRCGGTVLYADHYDVQGLPDQMVIRAYRSWYEAQRKWAATGRPIDFRFDDIASVTFRLGRQEFNKLDPIEEVEFFNRLAQQLQLKALDVSYTKINSLDSISNLTNVRYLDISGSKITSLNGISRFQHLKVLELDGTSIRDLSPISSLKDLTELSAYKSPVRDLTPLSNLRVLRSLDLQDTQVVDIASLRHCPKLGTLILISQKVDDWTPLLECQSLKNVYLSRENIDSEDLQRLRDGNPQLSIEFEYWRWN